MASAFTDRAVAHAQPPGAVPGPILGAILAGGQSRRFGSDKAAAPYGKTTLIEHVAGLLAPQVDALIVTGGTPRAGLDVVADRPTPDLGPLGGLNAALHTARARGLPWVLMVPCDAAILPTDLVARLFAGLGGAPAALACTPTHGHPTVSLWAAALAAGLDDFMANARVPGDRSVRRWAERIGGVTVEFADGAIANVNTHADLAALGQPR